MNGISELFSVCAEAFSDSAPLKGKGLLIRHFNEKVTVAITADEPVKQKIDGWDLEIFPFTFYILKDGWLVGLINYGSGNVAHIGCTEDSLIEIIKKGAI
jgi:hypothetical protein